MWKMWLFCVSISNFKNMLKSAFFFEELKLYFQTYELKVFDDSQVILKEFSLERM